MAEAGGVRQRARRRLPLPRLRLPHRRPLRLCIILGAIVALSALLWLLAPALVADPMPALRRQTPVRSYSDCRGNVVYQERTWDYQWRFPVPLTDISEPVIACILATEDANFYHHHGVDYPAILRAAWQNLSSGHVVSGASTISMQLASLVEPGRSRNLWRKLHQASAARKLERLYDKDSILCEYLNRIPFGGKLHGIEAAAQYYFGRPARELNWAEASLLCGLPQRPNAYRPDRHLPRARERQRLVLHLLQQRGVISPERAQKILHTDPLRLRDFTTPAPFVKEWPDRFQHYFALAKRQAPNEFDLRCPLDPEFEGLLHHALQAQQKRLPGVHDGAAVLLDSSSSAVLALVGTLDFHAPQTGQVNAATASRNAGSTLKPFIYAEAIDGGLLVDSTVLLDAPLRFADYSPGNYDGLFRGRVTALDALSSSLNTPAVRLLARLGVSRLEERLVSLGLMSQADRDGVGDHAHGLSMVLGTTGSSLLDLSNAYATLARGGAYRPYSFLQSTAAAPAQPEIPIFTPGTAAMINRMLRHRPLPGAAIAAAWKTGTANGHHDAWCIAYTPDFTLGVWFGNKDGRAAAVLSGANAAAPCAADIISALYRNRPPPRWPDHGELLKAITLCAASGLAATPACSKTVSGLHVTNVPLQRCQLCRQHNAPTDIRILSPAPGTYLCGPDGTATIPLRSSAPDALWFIDDLFVGAIPPDASRPFPPGRHSVLLMDSDANSSRSARISFTVRRPETQPATVDNGSQSGIGNQD